MKLMRWGAEGHERPGLVDDDGGLRDLSAALGGSTATALDPEVQAALARLDPANLPALPPDTRLGACIEAGDHIISSGKGSQHQHGGMDAKVGTDFFTKFKAIDTGQYQV